jgi:peptide/nickel transport system substrate-binding protein
VLAASALMLTACGGTGTEASGDPVSGGTIVYAHQQEPACVYGGWIEQAYLSYQVLDSLTSLDENGEAVPWLAEEWEQSDDGLTWTFELKKDVTFTDGTPLDAEAVAYNVQYWLDGGNSTALAWLEGYVSSAEATGETTLTLHLDKPYPLLAETVSQGYFGIQSPDALRNRTEEENCAAPIGSGAFIVENWTRGESITLLRNDDYTSWPANAKNQGPAIVDEVDWRFVPDATTRATALKSDEVDAIYDIPAIEWSTLEQGDDELLKYVTPGRPQQISFNTVEGPFVDEKVRQAFVYALDRETLVDTVGQGVIPYEGNGSVSQSTPGYSQEAADWYDYDLDEAGWDEEDADGVRVKDGERLEIDFPYAAGRTINADGGSILQGVAEQAKAAGFDVNLIPVPPSEVAAGAYTQPDERDIFVGYWTSVTAGILWVTWRQNLPESPNGSNAAFYNSPELEEIILAANSEPDEDARNALYQQAQEYIAEHALAVGLYDRLSTLGISSRLKDVWQEHSQGGPVFHDAYFVG